MFEMVELSIISMEGMGFEPMSCIHGFKQSIKYSTISKAFLSVTLTSSTWDLNETFASPSILSFWEKFVNIARVSNLIAIDNYSKNIEFRQMTLLDYV